MEVVLEYRLENGQPVDVTWAKTDLLAQENTVYTRLVNDEIVYVGKAQRTLKKRMQEHLSFIRKGRRPDFSEFAEGQRVIVKAMKPGTVEAAGLVVDLAAGVERALMDAFSPRFNRRRG